VWGHLMQKERRLLWDCLGFERVAVPSSSLTLAMVPVCCVAPLLQMRATIKAVFPDRDVVVMVRPALSEQHLQQLDQLAYSQLRPEFRRVRHGSLAVCHSACSASRSYAMHGLRSSLETASPCNRKPECLRNMSLCTILLHATVPGRQRPLHLRAAACMLLPTAAPRPVKLVLA
jgi:hypothetical protein